MTENPSSAYMQASSLLDKLAPLLKENHLEGELLRLRQVKALADNPGARIMVCGEFKRGKSTLVNCLVGENVCPVDDAIATSTVSEIKFTPERTAIRHYSTVENDTDTVAKETVPFDKVCEAANVSGVSADNTLLIEIGLPSDYLRTGITLIDTPGIGGLEHRHLLLTRRALEHVDIVLFMIDCSEPVTKSEIDFLKDEVCPHAKNVAIVLNKADLLMPEDIAQLIESTKAKVKGAIGREIAIVPVSAARQKMFNKKGDPRYLDASNFKALFAQISESIGQYRSELRCLFVSEICSLIDSTLIPALNAQKEVFLKPDSAKEEILRRGQELSKARGELANPQSPAMAAVSTTISKTKSEIFRILTAKNILLSSEKLESLLTCKEAKAKDGYEWIIARINDEISYLCMDINSLMAQAFKSVSKKLEVNLPKILELEEKPAIVPEGKIDRRGSGEKMVYKSRNLMSGLGMAGLLSFASNMGLSFLAPVAIPAAIAFGTMSLLTGDRQYIQAEIRKTLIPKINLLLSELRTLIEERFTAFQSAIQKAISDKIAVANAELQTLQERMAECEAGEKAAQQKVVVLDNQIKMLVEFSQRLKIAGTNNFVK